MITLINVGKKYFLSQIAKEINENWVKFRLSQDEHEVFFTDVAGEIAFSPDDEFAFDEVETYRLEYIFVKVDSEKIADSIVEIISIKNYDYI